MALSRTHVQKVAALACSEGGVFGPLMPKGHPLDTPTGPVEWLVVSVGLNWARTSSKFLKNNASSSYYSDPSIRGAVFKEASGSLV